MNLLVFDTSTAACTAGIARADGEFFDGSPPATRMFEQPTHTTELLPALAAVLARAGLDWPDLDAVAVGTGPGAFTGLRIGVATARAIATARDLPLIPVSSLAALSAGAGVDLAGPGRPGATVSRPVEPAPVVALIDAKRGEIFHRFPGAGDDVATPELVVGRTAELAAARHRPLAVGDGAVKLRGELTDAGAEVPEANDARHLVDAASIARLAAEITPVAPRSVTPNYIRPPDAKTSSRASWLVAPAS